MNTTANLDITGVEKKKRVIKAQCDLQLYIRPWVFTNCVHVRVSVTVYAEYF